MQWEKLLTGDLEKVSIAIAPYNVTEMEKKPLIFHPGCLLHMLQTSVHPAITDARRNRTGRKRIEHSKESLCKENCDLKGESLCH